MLGFYVFLFFVILLVLSLFGAFGAYIAGQKGMKPLKGFWLCVLFNILGLIYVALKPNTSLNIVEQMYDRNLMDLKDFQDTMEVKIHKKTTKK